MWGDAQPRPSSGATGWDLHHLEGSLGRLDPNMLRPGAQHLRVPTSRTPSPLREAARNYTGPYSFLLLTTTLDSRSSGLGLWAGGCPSLGLFPQWQQDTKGQGLGPAPSRHWAMLCPGCHSSCGWMCPHDLAATELRAVCPIAAPTTWGSRLSSCLHFGQAKPAPAGAPQLW